VISGTEVANEFFQHMVPSKFIHDKYRPEIVMNVIKAPDEHQVQDAMPIRMPGAEAPPLTHGRFLILDDCLYDATWIKEESTRYVFMNGRHVDLTTMITMQYPLGITPNLRTNVDFVFILRENILREIVVASTRTTQVCSRRLRCSVRSWISVQRTLNAL
jgi:hypothetical protein